jgi:pantothenate synthetase
MNNSKYRTLLDAVAQLRAKGYKYGFKLKDKVLECLESGQLYRPDELRIVEYHRFKDKQDPHEAKVVFAIRTEYGEMGTIVSNYGLKTNWALLSFLDKVKILDR